MNDTIVDITASVTAPEQTPEKPYIPNVYGINALGRLIKVLVFRRMMGTKELEIYHTDEDGTVSVVAELTQSGIIVSKWNKRVTFDGLRDDGRSWAISHALENLVKEIEDESLVMVDLNEPPVQPNPNFVPRGVNALGRLFKVLALRYLVNGGEREAYTTDGVLESIMTPRGIIVPNSGLRFRLKFIRDNGKIPAISNLLEKIIKDAEDNGIIFEERIIKKEPYRVPGVKMGSVFPK